MHVAPAHVYPVPVIDTNDNPAGSPTWTAWVPWWVADWDCRAAEVKLALTNGSPTHDIRITGLTVRARDPV